MTTPLPQPERHWYRPPTPAAAPPPQPVAVRPIAATPEPTRVEASPPWWTYVLVILGLLVLWPFVLVVWAAWWILKAVGIVGAAGTVPFWGVLHPASRRAPWWG